MTISQVIETVLISLFRKDIFSNSLFLKGGQALRYKEDLKLRFSGDIDFSTPGSLNDSKIFFDVLEKTISESFFETGYYLFDFKPTRRPEIRRTGLPDFWTGWEVVFKLIESSKSALPLVKMRKEALIPEGSASSKIKIDISEYEYCDSVEKIKVSSQTINVYSRVSLLVEKIRAICQQHPDYQLRAEGVRPRDFFDIESLWRKVLSTGKKNDFIKECRIHLPGIFKAKDVDISLTAKIFVKDFLDLNNSAWPSVIMTLSIKPESFDYYVETLREIITLIFAEGFDRQ